MNQRKFSQY